MRQSKKSAIQRMSRVDLEQSYSACDRDLTLNRIALMDMVNDSITWLDWQKVDENESYRYGFGRLDSASGGYIIHIFRYVGQSDMVRVEYLDDAYVPTEYRLQSDVIRINAISAAKTARYRLLAA